MSRVQPNKLGACDETHLWVTLLDSPARFLSLTRIRSHSAFLHSGVQKVNGELSRHPDKNAEGFQNAGIEVLITQAFKRFFAKIVSLLQRGNSCLKKIANKFS